VMMVILLMGMDVSLTAHSNQAGLVHLYLHLLVLKNLVMV